jgi:hypothetical protein
MALFNKGNRLHELGRSNEAVHVYEEVVTRFADDSDPAVRENVNSARRMIERIELSAAIRELPELPED